MTSHWDDHHPDHQATANLVREACYLAEIGNYPASTSPPLAPHRPEPVLFYLDRLAHQPQLVVDVTLVFEQWQSRHRFYGSQIGVAYGEAYVLRSPVQVQDPMSLVWGRKGLV